VSCAFVLAALLSLGQADPKPSPSKEEALAKQALVDKVNKLVKQLDDDSQERRDAAQKALIEIGPSLLDILPSPGAKDSTEKKARLAKVRIEVEKVHIESFTRPSLVTLQGKMKLSEAIASLEKQSGNTLIDARERLGQEVDNPTITLSIEKATFWEGLDHLLDASGLSVYLYSDAPAQLLLMNKAEGDAKRGARGSYAGLFRVEAKRLQATRDLKNAMGSNLRITADIAWEPRLRPILLEMPLADLTAVDENGTELQNSDDGEREYGTEGNNAAVEIELQVGLPKRAVTKIASVKGKFTALVPGRIERFEFSKLQAKNVKQERGACTVVLEELRKNDEVHEIVLRMKFDEAANALESHRNWVQNNEAYILDPKGNKLEPGAFSPSVVAKNEVALSYAFDLSEIDIAKCRFVYETPAALFKVPVEFELKDLELP
jgi:hypothetical protein